MLNILPLYAVPETCAEGQNAGFNNPKNGFERLLSLLLRVFFK
jgi:hypothetical protein